MKIQLLEVAKVELDEAIDYFTNRPEIVSSCRT
jgi:exonuclease VII small subunit